MSPSPEKSPSVAKTPSALGFRLPAEWEPQAAVWMSWPHKRSTWPGHFRPVPAAFAAIVAQISRREKVRINAARALQPRALGLLLQAGADLANVEFYPHATDDAWCRDHGPIFVKQGRTGEVAATIWRYNAWGGKYPPYNRDRRIASRVAQTLGRRGFASPMVLEGGSIDGNGQGVLLTTESCLLNRNRNPRLSRVEIEDRLKQAFGVRTILWLGEGIVGDDTDGHIDDLSRFFSADGIVTMVETDPRDANHRPLQENLERLRGFRTPAGGKFRLVELPMPAPCRRAGRRMPASYANFLIINGAVLLPTFRQPRRDAAAADILAGCFPGREIVPIDCLDLVWGLGAIHCLTPQEPL